MAESEDEMLLLLLMMRKKRRKNRKIHVHPLLIERRTKGLFHTLYEDLRKDNKMFYQYFRMSKGSFDELLETVRGSIVKIDTKMRTSIPPDERLGLTLRYLGGGSTMTDLHIQYRIGISTIALIVRDVCGAMWKNLKSKCFVKLTPDVWLKISSEFLARANFPHCIGAVDGKHIRVVRPTDTGSLYFNYKKYFSILLLAICDANYKFIFIDVGACGKSADSTILQNSMFYKKLLSGDLNIPQPRDMDIGFEDKMPFMLIADEGFGQSQFILRPYAGKYLTEEKRIFNYRLTRARRYIECTFGILANKWRILHRPLNVDIELANLIIRTCCILHNFVRDRDGFKFEDSLIVRGLYDMARCPVPGGKVANNIRNQFTQYFSSPQGSILWQKKKIGKE